MDALTTQGLVSITDLPKDAKEAFQTMIAKQHSCLLMASIKQVQTLSDGTIRRTFATQHSVAGGVQTLKFENSMDHSPGPDYYNVCYEFASASYEFRQFTQTAVMAFAQLVTSVLPVDNDSPILKTLGDSENDPFGFKTFADVVENGDYLEHFHSYQMMLMKNGNTTTTTQKEEEEDTIDVHTDQGLFSVFTPGRLSNGTELTRGFYIQSGITGALEEMIFTKQDELVFMLGDDVNQYINPKITGPKLRAVTHALRLELTTHPTKYDDEDASNAAARVWYGLMVLPPLDAIHPLSPEGYTFGQIRQGLVDGNKNMISLACSSLSSSDSDCHNVTAQSRRLDGRDEQEVIDTTTCAYSEEIYCNHRCINATEYSVSVEQCTSSNQRLVCTNPRGQVSDGVMYGDFYPGCVSANASNLTDFPTLPNYPRNESLCMNDFAEVFMDGTYDHAMELPDRDGSEKARLSFTRNGDSVQLRLVFNGIFGYLAVGFVGYQHLFGELTDYGKPPLAMYGGKIILAYRGGDYSPVTGQDLTLNDTVAEYVMDDEQASFRHWSEPYDPLTNTTDVIATQRSGGGRRRNLAEKSPFTSYSIETTDDECYTALRIDAATSIAGQTWNFSGIDTFMWAANDEDRFMQYHGPNQGIFTIDWNTLYPFPPTSTPSSAPSSAPSSVPSSAPSSAPSSVPSSAPRSAMAGGGGASTATSTTTVLGGTITVVGSIVITLLSLALLL